MSTARSSGQPTRYPPNRPRSLNLRCGLPNSINPHRSLKTSAAWERKARFCCHGVLNPGMPGSTVAPGLSRQPVQSQGPRRPR
jgi:hypothetical protein